MRFAAQDSIFGSICTAHSCRWTCSSGLWPSLQTEEHELQRLYLVRVAEAAVSLHGLPSVALAGGGVQSLAVHV
jgi:hypothetical protein